MRAEFSCRESASRTASPNVSMVLWTSMEYDATLSHSKGFGVLIDLRVQRYVALKPQTRVPNSLRPQNLKR